MAYLLDTSVFITARRVHYGFDFCPGFWDWIHEQHRAGVVFSIARVFDELRAQQDELADWAGDLPEGFFLEASAATVSSYAAVSTWASSQRYRTPAINDFLQTADYHLVAQANQGGHVVVTYEVPRGSDKQIKIPDACLGLRVGCILPHDMLRRERARFVLGART